MNSLIKNISGQGGVLTLAMARHQLLVQRKNIHLELLNSVWMAAFFRAGVSAGPDVIFINEVFSEPLTRTKAEHVGCSCAAIPFEYIIHAQANCLGPTICYKQMTCQSFAAWSHRIIIIVF